MQVLLNSPYFEAYDDAGILIGKTLSANRAFVGICGTAFLLREKDDLIAFETFRAFQYARTARLVAGEFVVDQNPSGPKIFTSKELGRYQIKEKHLLGYGDDFIVLRDGNWIVTVDYTMKGIARDLIPGSAIITIEDCSIAVRFGDWITLYDKELQEKGLRRA